MMFFWLGVVGLRNRLDQSNQILAGTRLWLVVAGLRACHLFFGSNLFSDMGLNSSGLKQSFAEVGQRFCFGLNVGDLVDHGSFLSS
jgi:hypothetical protein